MRFVDLTGKRFGSLVVIKRTRKIGREIFWLCKCDCGNEKEIVGRRLTTKVKPTRICRIAGFHDKIGKGVAAFNSVYNHTRINAKKRGYEWNLTKKQVMEISQKNCFYCGKRPGQVAKKLTLLESLFIME